MTIILTLTKKNPEDGEVERDIFHQMIEADKTVSTKLINFLVSAPQGKDIGVLLKVGDNTLGFNCASNISIRDIVGIMNGFTLRKRKTLAESTTE